MGKHNDNMFRKVVTGGLQRQHTAGIAKGAYAMCSVIRDKAMAEGKTAEEKVEDIIKFCDVCMNPRQLEAK